jgi:hypothetical protein
MECDGATSYKAGGSGGNAGGRDLFGAYNDVSISPRGGFDG